MNKGFTLIEVIVAVGILGIIFVAMSSFQVNVHKYNNSASQSLQNSHDARSLIRVIVKELRTAKQGNDGSYPIAEASTSSIAFYSDIDDDGLQEKIRYYMLDNKLHREVTKQGIEESSILVSNLQNGTSTKLFEYYGTSLANVNTIADIRMVKINILLSNLHTTQVLLRNLKDI